MGIQMQLFDEVSGTAVNRDGAHGTTCQASKQVEQVASPEVGPGNMATSGSEGVAIPSGDNVSVAVVRFVNGIEPWKKNEDRKRASAKQLLKLVHDQRFLCVTCGVKLTPETSEIDHIVPRADGGGNDISNLQWLCVRCNRAKGTMRHGQFLELCERVARHNACPG